MLPTIPLRLLAIVFSSFAALAWARAESPGTVASPDGRLIVTVQLDAQGRASYSVTAQGKPVLEASALGLIREDADFTSGLKHLGTSKVEKVKDKYEILTSKRRHNTYTANRRVFRFQNGQEKPIEVIFQVSDDGAAFRYHFPDFSETLHRITDETSSFRFPAASVAWLQPISEAKTGFGQSNPSYEEYYEKQIPVGTPSPTKAGWVFPALFRTGNTWVVISETAVSRRDAASRLRPESPNGEYRIGLADPREIVPGGGHLSVSTLPWSTPWRTIAIGTLKQVTESNLGVDLADAPAKRAYVAQPGKSSWSWPLLGDSKTVFEVQKQFVDYAVDMGWGYTLVDAEWDRQIGYDRMKELVRYAKSRGVKVLVWYNSAGSWNTTPQTPRDRLLTAASREAEFKKLKDIGVAGLKVDFFGGDGQSMIAYYHDLLQDSERYGFAMNFHGCTLPRGWQRTYPHLMTMEAIRGLEFATFEQSNADQVPTHAAMLPFTRNVYDPMDFTPVVLDRMPNTKRRTTAAFELALSVLFTSGIQHYAEIPDGMAKAPQYVRDFLKHVPSIWDDIHFLDGFPGQHVALARRAGKKWYIAGINGLATEKALVLDLSPLGLRKGGTLISDGADSLGFAKRNVDKTALTRLTITLPANGGFVLEAE